MSIQTCIHIFLFKYKMGNTGGCAGLLYLLFLQKIIIQYTVDFWINLNLLVYPAEKTNLVFLFLIYGHQWGRKRWKEHSSVILTSSSDPHGAEADWQCWWLLILEISSFETSPAAFTAIKRREINVIFCEH